MDSLFKSPLKKELKLRRKKANFREPGPEEGDKVKIRLGWKERGRESMPKGIGTFIKLTPDSRSEGGNKRGDYVIVKWEDGTTTEETYYDLVKVKEAKSLYKHLLNTLNEDKDLF